MRRQQPLAAQVGVSQPVMESEMESKAEVDLFNINHMLTRNSFGTDLMESDILLIVTRNFQGRFVLDHVANFDGWRYAEHEEPDNGLRLSIKRIGVDHNHVTFTQTIDLKESLVFNTRHHMSATELDMLHSKLSADKELALTWLVEKLDIVKWLGSIV